MHDATVLLNCQGGDPNGNEAVLPERKPVTWVPGDLKEELPVASGVS
jgi:hypothetical protein